MYIWHSVDSSELSTIITRSRIQYVFGLCLEVCYDVCKPRHFSVHCNFEFTLAFVLLYYHFLLHNVLICSVRYSACTGHLKVESVRDWRFKVGWFFWSAFPVNFWVCYIQSVCVCTSCVYAQVCESIECMHLSALISLYE